MDDETRMATKEEIEEHINRFLNGKYQGGPPFICLQCEILYETKKEKCDCCEQDLIVTKDGYLEGLKESYEKAVKRSQYERR